MNAKNLGKYFGSTKGVGLVNVIVGVTIGAVLVATLAIPVINSSISNGNITGIQATLLALVGTFLVIALIVVVSKMM